MSTSTLTISNLGSVTFAKSQRAKYQRITVRPDKTIIVTIPRSGSLGEAKQFLKATAKNRSTYPMPGHT